MTALDGALLLGDERHLGREAEHMLVFAMSTEHVLERLRDGQLCIAAGDRPEALITLAAAHAADGFPALAGGVLNGGYRPSDPVRDLVAGTGPTPPVTPPPPHPHQTTRHAATPPEPGPGG